jgi:hypothetical protein
MMMIQRIQPNQGETLLAYTTIVEFYIIFGINVYPNDDICKELN